MKIILLLAMAAAIAAIAACAAGKPGSGLTTRSAVVVDGQPYDIGQLTESTWTAPAHVHSNRSGYRLYAKSCRHLPELG